MCLFVGFRGKICALWLRDFLLNPRSERDASGAEKQHWKGRLCFPGRETEDRLGPSRTAALEQQPLTGRAGLSLRGAAGAAGGLSLTGREEGASSCARGGLD